MWAVRFRILQRISMRGHRGCRFACRAKDADEGTDLTHVHSSMSAIEEEHHNSWGLSNNRRARDSARLQRFEHHCALMPTLSSYPSNSNL